MPRSSENEASAPLVGANVNIYYKDDLLAKVHLLHLQVQWSSVELLYREAENNEKQGIMKVDLSQMKRDGQLLFDDNFSVYFKEIFVKRFIPCVVEKFNQRNPADPLVNLPMDVADALRLLVVCERLNAVIKQDVRAHLEQLLDKSLLQDENRPANESAAFRVFQTSMDIDVIAPPRSSLQELIVNRSLEMLISKLPDSLDALSELHMIASEMRRHHMCNRLFKATTKRSMDFNSQSAPLASKREASKNEAAAQENAEERERLRVERESLDQEKQKLRSEFARLEQAKQSLQAKQVVSPTNNAHSRESSFTVNGTFRSGSDNGASGSSSHNGAMGGAAPVDGMSGVLALRQGILLEKIGRSSGNRIVRLMGDTLEWRKEYGRFTRDHSVMRQDVISVKTSDQHSFSISSKSGILTLRALSDQTALLFAQAIDVWVKGKAGNNAATAAAAGRSNAASSTFNRLSVASSMHAAPPMASMRIPAPSSQNMPTQAANTTNGGTLISRRFAKMSTTFTRPTENTMMASNSMGAPPPPMPKTAAPLDYSFGSTDST